MQENVFWGCLRIRAITMLQVLVSRNGRISDSQYFLSRASLDCDTRRPWLLECNFKSTCLEIKIIYFDARDPKRIFCGPLSFRGPRWRTRDLDYSEMKIIVYFLVSFTFSNRVYK